MKAYTIPILLIAVFGAPFWLLPAMALCVSILRKSLAALARLKTGRRFQLPTFAWESKTVADRWEAFWESPKATVLMLVVGIASILAIIYAPY